MSRKGNGEGHVQRVILFLKDILTGNEIPAKEVEDLAIQEGISKSTLNRAKKAVGIRSKKVGNQWVWEL